MKILITTHYFLPHTGGIENVAYNQARGLVKKGHEVTIVTSGTENAFETVEGIMIKRVKAMNVLEKVFGIPYPIFYPSIVALLHDEVRKSDVVHLHGHVFMPSVIASYFAHTFKKPTVVTQHNTFVEYKSWLARLIQTIADKTLGKYTFANSGKILAVSRKTQHYIESIIQNSNVTVLYNGINVSRFGGSYNNTALKKKLGIENKFVCLSVRRITFKNGIDTILEVAEKLQGEDIIFLIGGTGPDRAKVEAHIEEKDLTNVKLLGFIPDEKLPQYYSLADIFILPSKKGEGFPLVVLEAFASGVPVIATKSGGHEEIIKNGTNGYLVDVDNPQQMSKKIEYLKNNASLLDKMRMASSNLARVNFSWHTNINNLVGVYEEVIK